MTDNSEFLGELSALGFNVVDPAAPVLSFGKHRRFSMIVEGGDGGFPRDASWCLRFMMNSATVNVWSRANFPNVTAAYTYARVIADAIETAEAENAPAPIIAPAGKEPHGPREALELCLKVLGAGGGARGEHDLAVKVARKALEAAPYPAVSLETAACLWEAVLTREELATRPPKPGVIDDMAKEIAAAREALGSAGLRLTVIGWTDAVDHDWRIADTAGGRVPQGGEYGGAFDWEFIPDWLALNVEWGGENGPTLAKVRIIPDCSNAPRDTPNDDTRETLERLGYGVDGGGAGVPYMARCFYRPGGDIGAHVIVTDREGGDMPRADDWLVGVYAGAPDEGRGSVIGIDSITARDNGQSLERIILIANNAALALLNSGED